MAFESKAKADTKSKFIKIKPAGLRGATKVRNRAVKEAKTNHTWARYAPGAPRVSGNVQINVAAAKTAKLALS